MKPKIRTKPWRLIKKLGIVAALACTSIAAFLALRPEGRFTPADGSAEEGETGIRILTWNILRGDGEGLLGAPWEKREKAFAAAFAPDRPSFDILCFQEALPHQIEFFGKLLPDHDWYGAGRDDGASGGEHCPIFFNRTRFQIRDRGTFWLSLSPEKPSCGWGEQFPRICSWVELEDQTDGIIFRIYNVHLHLHPIGQTPAAQFLAGRIREANFPVLVAGDMNCPPGWPAMRRFKGAGLREAETSGALTYQLFGKGVRCVDHIFTSDDWMVNDGGILRERFGGVSPSDHFGLWANCVPKKPKQFD